MKQTVDSQKRRRFLIERLPTHSIGAEIGVHEGDFSLLILDIVKPRMLHLIDPWKYEEDDAYAHSWYGGIQGRDQAAMDKRYERVKQRFSGTISEKKVILHRGSSREIGQIFPDHYFDWVYIDGNHMYDYVKGDLELFYRKTKKGGLLCGDDYVKGNWWQDGVIKAVDEFMQEYPVTVVDIKLGQYILKKNSSV